MIMSNSPWISDYKNGLNIESYSPSNRVQKDVNANMFKGRKQKNLPPKEDLHCKKQWQVKGNWRIELKTIMVPGAFVYSQMIPSTEFVSLDWGLGKHVKIGVTYYRNDN